MWNSYFDSLKNDWKQNGLVTNFRSIKHPHGTIMVAEREAMGLFGNGNHCDFFVGQIRTYTGTNKDLKLAYSALADPLQIRFIDDPEMKIFEGIPFGNLADWGIDITFLETHKIYVVWDFMNLPPNGDIRCH